METHPSVADPAMQISLALFDDVTNVSELRQMARDGKVTAALADPRLVVSRFHALAAADRAAHAQRCGKLTTRNVHAEVIYSLSGSKNISDAFRRFGVSDNMRRVLVVEVHAAGSSTMADISGYVSGRSVPLDNMADFFSEADVMKAYKVKDAELKVGTLEEAVVARMAAKDFVSF